MNRGTMGVNSLPTTITRQRRACDFESRPFCAWVPHESDFLCITPVWYTTVLTADRLKMQDWKIVNSLKYRYSLSCCTYVFHRCRFVLAFSVFAFSTLHIRTYVFRTCIFHPPVLSFSVLAFSVAPLKHLIACSTWEICIHTKTQYERYTGD